MAESNRFEIKHIPDRGYCLIDKNPSNEINELSERLDLVSLEEQAKTTTQQLIILWILPEAETREELICKLITKIIYEEQRQEHRSPNTLTYARIALNLLDKRFQRLSIEELSDFLIKIEIKENRYYGDDLSEDSDSEDEENWKKNEDLVTIAEIANNDNFWYQTKRNTPRSAGLQEKLTDLREKIKKKIIKTKKTAQESIEKIHQVFNKKTERSQVPRTQKSFGQLDQAQNNALDEINTILKNSYLAGEFKENQITRIRQLCEQHHFYTAHYRGLNYMIDRWNAPSRRYHRKLNELGRPQRSEMALRTLEKNFFLYLDEELDYTTNPELIKNLHETDEKIKRSLQELSQSGYCVAERKRDSSLYLFNSMLDYFQDNYSNGIDDFLKNLNYLRAFYPQLANYFPNARNPFVSMGSSAYHALEYAYGLKAYYLNPLRPRYHRDGTLEYSHAGKVYMFLHRFDELLFNEQPNNVSQMNKEGRIDLLRDIAPEKEIAFLSYVNGTNSKYHFVAKYPSFKGNYKKHIHLIKYGFTEEIYYTFKELIRLSSPNTALRNSVLALLSEWLCAYREVLLIYLANRQIKQIDKRAQLIFFNEEGLLGLEPPQLVTTQGSKNKSRREQASTEKANRKKLGQSLAGQPISKEHGVRIVEKENLFKENKHKNINFLTPQKPIVNSKDSSNYIDKKSFSTSAKGKIDSKKLTNLAVKKKLFTTPGEGKNSFKSNLMNQYFFKSALNRNNGIPQNHFGLIPHPSRFNYKSGNCLFEAIAQLLGENGSYYRALLVQHLQNSPQLRTQISATLHTNNPEDRQLLTVQGNRTYTTLEQYLGYIAQDQTWARYEELEMLSYILQRPIVVLSPNNMNDVIAGEHFNEENAIFLRYVNFNHYEPLQVPENKTKAEIFRAIKNTVSSGLFSIR